MRERAECPTVGRVRRAENDLDGLFDFSDLEDGLACRPCAVLETKRDPHVMRDDEVPCSEPIIVKVTRRRPMKTINSFKQSGKKIVVEFEYSPFGNGPNRDTAIEAVRKLQRIIGAARDNVANVKKFGFVTTAASMTTAPGVSDNVGAMVEMYVMENGKYVSRKRGSYLCYVMYGPDAHFTYDYNCYLNIKNYEGCD